MSLIFELSKKMRMSSADIERLIATAPKRYKVYQIPKKSGGVRTIAHPARELKSLQRCLVSLAPTQLNIHEAATAYEIETSIIKNVKRHVQNKWIGRLDFFNFFNSIQSKNWEDFLITRDVDEEYKSISSMSFFWQPKGGNSKRLSVGAPSSPFVSNRIMFDFDESVSNICDEEGITYTRYADDLTISAPLRFDLNDISKKLIAALPKYLQLDLNEHKSRLSGPGSRKVVTGLIVTDEGKITVGKKRRKLIEACIHHHINGKATISDEEIRGHLAFIKQVEPEVYQRYFRKFAINAPRIFSEDL